MYYLVLVKSMLFLCQVIWAGGLEPLDLQIKSNFLPAESGLLIEIICTSEGLTKNTNKIQLIYLITF